MHTAARQQHFRCSYRTSYCVPRGTTYLTINMVTLSTSNKVFSFTQNYGAPTCRNVQIAAVKCYSQCLFRTVLTFSILPVGKYRCYFSWSKPFLIKTIFNYKHPLSHAEKEFSICRIRPIFACCNALCLITVCAERLHPFKYTILKHVCCLLAVFCIFYLN